GSAGQTEGETTHGHQEMAGRSRTDDRLGQNTPSPEAKPDDENAPGQASGDLELLWADRQLSPNAAFLRRDLPGAAQVAQPAQSAPKYDLASIETEVGAFPSAATAHCGKEYPGNALPEGTEFVSAATGVSTAADTPTGTCESELT